MGQGDSECCFYFQKCSYEGDLFIVEMFEYAENCREKSDLLIISAFQYNNSFGV